MTSDFQNDPNRRSDLKTSQQDHGDERFDPSMYRHADENGGFHHPPAYPGGSQESGSAAPVRQRRMFWPVLFAVLLTASITFVLTAAAGYFLYGDRIRRGQGTVPGRLPGTTETGSASAPSETAGSGGDERLTLTFSDGEGVGAALKKFSSVYNLLQENYYKDKTDAEMIDLMTRGLIDAMGSPYTFYLTPEYREDTTQSMSGEYVGIGAVVMRDRDGNYVITDVIPNSPAEETGLQVGDIFLSIDGEDARKYEDVAQLAARVRGKAGTSVNIAVSRPSDGKEHTFSVERRSITNTSVRSKMVSDGIGYIHLTEFSAHAAENFENAVLQLMKQGAKHLVIDLRNNGGGYANECVNMLDVLLPKQDVVTIRGREDGKAYERTWSTSTAALVPDSMKYVILLNRYSASASELFSGVLRDLGKAVLVGEKSYGKGVGTITWDLPDKSAVQITTFEYFLPKGESIDGIGLVPDYPVSLSEEAASKAPNRLTLEEDTQLQKALEVLKPLVR